MSKLHNAERQPLVSVLLPVKDGGKYIRQAIDSVIHGVYQNYELVVVCAKSSDDTEDIVRSYSQARFLAQQTPGISAAFNQGIQEARGELIAFIAHDDIWRPNKLAWQVERLVADRSMFVVGRARFFLEPGVSNRTPGLRPELLESPKVAFIMETLLAPRSV